MKKAYVYLLAASIVCGGNLVFGQKSIKEYVEKTGPEKIKKNIVMGPGNEPVTAGGFADGHGKNPVLITKSQIPDTVALITYYIYDVGTEVKGGNYIYSYSLSSSGGNYFANKLHNEGIKKLKEEFRSKGIVLLTPEEFLNTPQKKNYYYKEFIPQISKLGSFLSGIETKGNDVSVAADGYRGFDISAAPDHLRSESLGGDLAKKLGVKGVFSIAIELMSSKKEVKINGIKMALHGPNPIPKEDKKYIAQNMGNGWYAGQLYSFGYMYFKDPILIGEFKKDQVVSENYEGIGEVESLFVDKFYDAMSEAIEKAAKKYSK